MSDRHWTATVRLGGLTSAPTLAQLEKLNDAQVMRRITYDPARQELRMEWSFPLPGTLRDAVADTEQMARKMMEYAHISGRVIEAGAAEWEAQTPQVVHLDLMGETETASWLNITEEALREQVRTGGVPRPVAEIDAGLIFAGEQVRRIAFGYE